MTLGTKTLFKEGKKPKGLNSVMIIETIYKTQNILYKNKQLKQQKLSKCS